MVSSRVTAKCERVVAPALAPGEQITMIDVVQLGKVSAKRRVATAAVAGIASGGLLMLSVKPRPYLIALTDRRVFLVDYGHTNVGKGIALAFDRMAMTAGPLTGHLLTVSMQIDLAEPSASYRFSWGRAQGKTARRVAAALTSA